MRPMRDATQLSEYAKGIPARPIVKVVCGVKDAVVSIALRTDCTSLAPGPMQSTSTPCSPSFICVAFSSCLWVVSDGSSGVLSSSFAAGESVLLEIARRRRSSHIFFAAITTLAIEE